MKMSEAIAALALLVAAPVTHAQQPPTEHDHQHAGSAKQEGHSRQGDTKAPHAMDDAMYVRMMKMHHEQGVKMADLALEKAQRADVKQFAQKTRASQQKDIEELEQIGKSLPAGTTGREQGASGQATSGSGSHGKMDHAKHMQMAQQMMQRLEQASGASFDDEFVRTMQHHHQMAIDMSQPSARFTSGEVKAFAARTVKTQGEEVQELKALQRKP